MRGGGGLDGGSAAADEDAAADALPTAPFRLPAALLVVALLAGLAAASAGAVLLRQARSRARRRAACGGHGQQVGLQAYPTSVSLPLLAGRRTVMPAQSSSCAAGCAT